MLVTTEKINFVTKLEDGTNDVGGEPQGIMGVCWGVGVVLRIGISLEIVVLIMSTIAGLNNSRTVLEIWLSCSLVNDNEVCEVELLSSKSIDACLFFFSLLPFPFVVLILLIVFTT